MNARMRFRDLPAAAVAGLDPLEDDWLSWVVARAVEHEWLVNHQRVARTAAGWRTLVQGVVGFPDLVLARAGVVLIPELKTRKGRLTAGQRRWAAAIGGQWRLWRPSDAEAVLAELAHPRPVSRSECLCAGRSRPDRGTQRETRRAGATGALRAPHDPFPTERTDQ